MPASWQQQEKVFSDARRHSRGLGQRPPSAAAVARGMRATSGVGTRISLGNEPVAVAPYGEGEGETGTNKAAVFVGGRRRPARPLPLPTTRLQRRTPLGRAGPGRGERRRSLRICEAWPTPHASRSTPRSDSSADGALSALAPYQELLRSTHPAGQLNGVLVSCTLLASAPGLL
jgi:hypothetical protein